MVRPGNQHCTSCIDTRSFPISYDKIIQLPAPVARPENRPSALWLFSFRAHINLPAKGFSIGLSVFAQLARVRNTHKHRLRVTL